MFTVIFTAIFAVLILSSLFGSTLTAKPIPTPVTISFSAAAFIGAIEMSTPYDFDNAKISSYPYIQTLQTSTANPTNYYAPVQLPQGAIITKIGFYANDKDPWWYATLSLCYTPSSSIMGGGTTDTWNVGKVMSTDTSSNTFPACNYNSALVSSSTPGSVVDNKAGAYYLVLNMPMEQVGSGSICFYTAHIEYQIP
jgi:hypothetical protein